MEVSNDSRTTFLYTGENADVYVTKSQYKFNGLEWGEQHIFIQGFPGFQPDTRTACEMSVASTQTNPTEIQPATQIMFPPELAANAQTQVPSNLQMLSPVTQKPVPTTPQKSELPFYAPSVKATPKPTPTKNFMTEHDVLENSQSAFLPGPSACYIDSTLLRKTPSFEFEDNDSSKQISRTPRLSSPITVKTPTMKNSFCTHTNVLSNNRKKLTSNTHDIWIRMLYSWLLELDDQMNFGTCLKKFLGAYLHPKPNNGPKQEFGELLSFSDAEESLPELDWSRAERRKIAEFKLLHSKMDKEEWNYISKNFVKCGKINYSKVPVLQEFASILQDSLKRSNIQKTPSWEATNCSCDAPKLTQAELDKFNSSFINSSSLASSHTPSITASLTESASASSASASSASSRSSSKSSTPSIPTANLQTSSSSMLQEITVAPVLVYPQPIHPFFKTPANIFNTSPGTVKTNFEQSKPLERNTSTSSITTLESPSSSESELHKSLRMEDFAPRLPAEEVIRLYTCIYLDNYQELWNSDVVILQNTLVAEITNFMERHPVIEEDILDVVFKSIDLYVGIYTELESLPQFT
eukprot:CAMPEP_0168570466 /NCGR_PEP_ID=MMETSP0413-20121227/16740_1 /TAXON_ID=136452 /ORGANISM="Filamoeba nolandi, Strain NC-AS-23-1" /LENGTH=580 /DNA_ID=CAMNT_0008603099 /DNA_START=224 /DNA_END=1966 /DNA_ORIENTATION=-